MNLILALLLDIQCLGRHFKTPQQLCSYLVQEDKLYGLDYTSKLHAMGDNALLLGRIKELEDANRRLRAELKKK